MNHRSIAPRAARGDLASIRRTAASFARLAATLVALCVLPTVTRAADAERLRTVAEKSDYRATARHAEVLDFCAALAEASPLVRRASIGQTVEGRDLPLLIVAEPPVAKPADLRGSRKSVVLLFANIHGGEVDGKEAVLMLARDIALAKERPTLKNIVLLVVPNLNADGNERIGRDNRPGQIGPVDGMGVRENAQGLDLNRDFVKLDSPEIRSLVRLVEQWNPRIIVDCHTTNGSYHRYALTYDTCRNPAADPELIRSVRDEMLPDVTRRVEKLGGWKTFFYGNFAQEHAEWRSYDALPRFSTQYFGLRGHVAILSESYAYASYKDRVGASRDFCRAIVEHEADRLTLLADSPAGTAPEAAAAATAAAAAAKSAPIGALALRARPAPIDGTFVIPGYVEEIKDGRNVPTTREQDYKVAYWGRCEPTVTTTLPAAYLLPASFAAAAETLQRHGIRVERLREDLELNVEAYRVTKIAREAAEFQKRRLATFEIESRRDARRIPAGTLVVPMSHPTNQPLQRLAGYLLEPQSEDGLAAWNFFDVGAGEGSDFPVLRLVDNAPMLTVPLAALPEFRPRNQRITMAMLYDGAAPSGHPHGDGPATPDPHAARSVNLSGNPLFGLRWHADGQHYLETRGGRLQKVDALGGRKQPLLENPEALREALAAIPSLDKNAVGRMMNGSPQRMNAACTAALFEHANDLYYALLDGSRAVRLTATPQREELATFSPNGRFVAFVREHDLYVVDVETATERRLTVDGGPKILHGKADWVYFEEIFHRNEQAYWWSPDSQRIAFLRTDDTPVATFSVADPIPPRQPVELTPYPKAGDPLPLVQIGFVTVAGGEPLMANLGGYTPEQTIVARAGFNHDGSQGLAYVLNRTQTWMDVVRVDLSSGQVTTLFRESTKAWVQDHGAPEFLPDGSFLFLSERDGFRHIYHYAAEGSLIRRLTEGPWDVSRIQRLDAAAGWVYFSGTKDAPRGSQLFRVKLDGTQLTRLTNEPGSHSVTLSANSAYAIVSHSAHDQPTRVSLISLDGKPVRTLDTNPVDALDEFTLGKWEHVQIPTPDGFSLEGSLLLPPDFTPDRRYPVWVKTYGGPYAPSLRDAWMGGNLQDQAHANGGFLVFHVDPRPASGKGVASAWTAYRQLGKQELADLETAVRWLAQRSYVDASRVGLSGYSYGGYLTAYALTHSKLFAAGVAGAPVTDWRNYDAIYTERYMGLPQDNPKGYDESSVVQAAGKLSGRLLIVHGMMDDNVHVQNTLQLLGAFQAADKYVEVQLYPRARHGIPGKHFPKLSYDFMRRTLRPDDK